MGLAPAILIVEDQDLMRASLRDYVQTVFPECTVLEAPDGACALRSCDQHRPDLVLMDIRLPDADGIGLTARIKAVMPATAVIIVSYLNGRIYVEQASAAGAQAYVTKDRLVPDLVPAMTDALKIAPAFPYGIR